MYDHTHMLKSIRDAGEAEICRKNLHALAILKDMQTKETIRVPYASIITNYRDFLSKCVINIALTDSEMMRYQYSPKWLSEYLYGTTELWSALLDLNGMISILEFNRPKIRIYEQRSFNNYLNEILIMEGRVME